MFQKINLALGLGLELTLFWLHSNSEISQRVSEALFFYHQPECCWHLRMVGVLIIPFPLKWKFSEAASHGFCVFLCVFVCVCLQYSWQLLWQVPVGSLAKLFRNGLPLPSSLGGEKVTGPSSFVSQMGTITHYLSAFTMTPDWLLFPWIEKLYKYSWGGYLPEVAHGFLQLILVWQ